MKKNKYVIYLLLLLFPFISCSKLSTAKEEIGDPVAEEVPSFSFATSGEENVEEEIENAKAQYERMKEKPILNFYTATINGQEVQVRESSAIGGEDEGAYIYVGLVGKEYIEEDSEGADSIVVKNGVKYLRHDGSEYPLSGNKLFDIKLYSDLDYKIIVANSIQPLGEDDYWHRVTTQYESKQSFVPVSKTNLYDKVFASDAFLDLTLGEARDDLKKWSYRLHCDTLETDDVQFVQWDISKTSPLRFDSVVFIVQTVGDVYMGGAHGMGYSASYNFDVKTGKLIELADIVSTNSHTYEQLLKDKINEAYDLSDYDTSNEEPSSFTIYSNGIVLTFPPYSLGGGFWEKDIFLSYNELEKVLKKEYYPIR